MRRRLSAVWFTAPLSAFIGLIIGMTAPAWAVWTDVDLCPGTGAECIITTHHLVTDPDGIDVRPLTLHIKAGGALIASTSPLLPLTIKAGSLLVDKFGAITGTVPANKGNTLNLITEAATGQPGDVTILGTVDVSSTRLNGTGGDGGSLMISSPGACSIGGRVLANGTPSTSIGGGGGDISFDCGSINVTAGALLEANGAGVGGGGGSIALNSNVGGITVGKKTALHAVGSGLDGGSVSISTNSNDVSDPCNIAGKILLDAKTLGEDGGSGGGVDISCGADVNFQSGAAISTNGMDGGGSVDLFAGGSLNIQPRVAFKSNGDDGSGGTFDMVAAGDTHAAGKILARSGGLIGNEGSISFTNGGDLVIQKGSVLDVSAIHKDQQTGEIVLVGGVADVGTPPVMTIEKGATLKAAGLTTGFGELDVDLSGSVCTVSGKIKGSALGGAAAAIGLVCDSLTLDTSSNITVAASAGSGGSLSLDTTGEFSTSPGPCALNGAIALKGAPGTTIDPNTGNPVVLAGHGGSVSATCGLDLSVGDRGAIDVGAVGAQGVGGDVSLSANLPAHVQGSIKATSSGKFSSGGSIAVGAPDVYLDAFPGMIDVGGETGGSIEIDATDGTAGGGVAHVEKALNAKGTFGGYILVRGCDVMISKTGWLRADGSSLASSGGNNEVRAGNKLTIGGKMTALNGHNSLLVSPSTVESLAGTIKPAAVADTSLTACP